MKVKIIAEIGINHNGDMNICQKLIDVAVSSGCDAVKFQKRTIDKVYSKEILDSFRESPWGNTQREQKQGLEFNEQEYDIINDYCAKKNIDWFASAWDVDSLNFLKKYKSKFNKIASAMIVDNFFLNEVAKEKKYTYISTGMSNMEQIENAVNIFRTQNCPFELMHCVSTYPMPDKDANLNCMSTLKKKFNCNIGYSGHETGLAISYAAVALGATSLERHITLDRTLYGSDQAASIEPAGLKHLVGAVRKIELAMGDGIKKVTNEEIEVAKKLRAHIIYE
ncbi:MAG: N-acetylneuraminate synthase [Crocinitomicaceae bacterium TMED209]|nr:MAG: N-acetylneuraminate synthase [Crocinitomicaceae bacterium TMED209]|tara:strand:- start:136 stop:975 length:840 start_codon:yes stop_codon:yes gene_type:complete